MANHLAPALPLLRRSLFLCLLALRGTPRGDNRQSGVLVDFRDKRSAIDDWEFWMRDPLKIIATAGLVLGGGFGIAGAMVSQPLQAILWAIDGAGLVMATVLLTIKCFRTGNDVVAGGFLVFAIGEGVLLSSAVDPGSSIPSFAAGITQWGTALLLVSVPGLFALPVRIIGIVSAILFILTAARIFMGEQLLPTSTPLAIDAYPFLVATFIGWIWMLWGSKKLDGNKS
jgi:hypothetical protein